MERKKRKKGNKKKGKKKGKIEKVDFNIRFVWSVRMTEVSLCQLFLHKVFQLERTVPRRRVREM